MTNFILFLFLYTAFKSFVTQVLEPKAGLNRRIKFICVAKCSLVMNLCSCDLLVTPMHGCARGWGGRGSQCGYEAACSKVDNYLC